MNYGENNGERGTKPVQSPKRQPQAQRLMAMLALGCLLGMSMGNALADEWTAPPDAAAVSNPIASSAQVLQEGAAIYHKRCEGCHGSKGKGDGPDASDLSITPADLGAKETQQQSDGALFWKIQNGKKPMPKYATRLTADQIWTVVHQIRTFQAVK